jgi:hypothetical protein
LPLLPSSRSVWASTSPALSTWPSSTLQFDFQNFVTTNLSKARFWDRVAAFNLYFFFFLSTQG